ncbi:MAG TPA: hypothetical protein VGH19_00725 [Verrucomicrobiae bacterium]
MKKTGQSLTLVLLLLSLTGCASFERDWRHALVQPPARTATPAGPWKGTWLSHPSGHTGELRCLVTEKATGRYEFRFKATYWKVFRYSYSVEMPVQCDHAESCNFKGSEHLGLLAGGTYHYEGSIAGTNLTATYRCKIDHGIFQMSRP